MLTRTVQFDMLHPLLCEHATATYGPAQVSYAYNTIGHLHGQTSSVGSGAVNAQHDFVATVEGRMRWDGTG